MQQDDYGKMFCWGDTYMTTTFNDAYEIKSLIGHSGMSIVYLTEHKRH